jgi:hypothetical protein
MPPMSVVALGRHAVLSPVFIIVVIGDWGACPPSWGHYSGITKCPGPHHPKLAVAFAFMLAIVIPIIRPWVCWKLE